jgi:hypothetical protein
MANTTHIERAQEQLVLVTDYNYATKVKQLAQHTGAIKEALQKLLTINITNDNQTIIS